MAKEVIRVYPLSTYLEPVKAPASVATRHGDTIYASGFRRSIRRPARSPTHRSSGKPNSCRRS